VVSGFSGGYLSSRLAKKIFLRGSKERRSESPVFWGDLVARSVSLLANFLIKVYKYNPVQGSR